MNKLLIQQELRTGRPLHELVARYNLLVKRHERYNNLVHFKYDQLESPMREQLVQQCRGIILDEDENWRCVSRPFDKFFNMGDPNAATFDWKFARIHEKLDGSLMVLYNYRGIWHVASSGTPDASGEVNGFGFTFKELFWRVWNERKYQLPLLAHITFMFELMTPYNEVIVRHPENRLVLIGARQRDTGLYEPLHRFDGWGWEVNKMLSWQSLADLMKFNFDPMKMEGYVVSDAEGNMVKLKHPGYVIAHQLKGSFSPRMVIEAVRSGDFAEIVATFPEWRDDFMVVKNTYDKLANRITGVWLATKDTPVKKDFALKVKALPFSGVLFGLYDKHFASVTDGLRAMQVDRLQDLLEKTANT